MVRRERLGCRGHASVYRHDGQLIRVHPISGGPRGSLHPGVQEPDGLRTRPQGRPAGMSQRLTHELPDPCLYVGEDLCRRSFMRRPVCNHRPGIADKSGSAMMSQRRSTSALCGVSEVGSERQEPYARRKCRSGPLVDRFWDELQGKRPGRQAVARHALITANAAQREQPLGVRPSTTRLAEALALWLCTYDQVARRNSYSSLLINVEQYEPILTRPQVHELMTSDRRIRLLRGWGERYQNCISCTP